MTTSGGGTNKYKVKNWYADRYFSAIIQRNFLFLFATVSSVGILISLILLKNLYEQKSVDPYLIEIEKQSNMMAVVDNVSKEQYTAQEAIKEYFIVKYLNSREGFAQSKADDDLNLVRVFSTKDIYDLYVQSSGTTKSQVSMFARDTAVSVKIRSISYLTPNRVEIRFSRELVSQELSKKDTKYYTLVLGFNFVSLDLSQNDLRLNPLGFQITTYALREDKVFTDNDDKKST